jgi:hypothetical protein
MKEPVREMRDNPSPDSGHECTVVTTHVLRQREGVPYEVERLVCAECGRVVDERPLRRAAA